MNFPTLYQEYIYKSRYARWIEDLGRRENWMETVVRYQNYMLQRVPEYYRKEFLSACAAVLDLDVMPSMRCLWTAGEALDVDNIAGYNCAYLLIDEPKAFADVLYILMCGTGVGFSVEREYIKRLPEVPSQFTDETHLGTVKINVADSKKGWAEAFYRLLYFLWKGVIPSYDMHKIRPKGAKLKTFGGRASGAEPLKLLFDYTINLFKNAQGRKLTSLECHDLCCMVANCVVVGGVRRSATISLSNLTDQRMRHAKDGEFWQINPHRTLANNSACYTEKPDVPIFMEEMLALIRSGTGERGIINREALIRSAVACGRENRDDYGVNPCGEIILKPQEFCNLTEVILRPTDTRDTICDKVRYATILGVIQSTLTDFNFIGKNWKKNCEEERLIGVSLTGLNDSGLNINADTTWLANELQVMRNVVRNTAAQWANALSINVPKAMTCVKPSGTVSQLVDASSGIHTRYAPYYIRRVRSSITDPITKLMMDAGVPCNPEVGQSWDNVSTVVFDFPIESPCTSKFRGQTALHQLNYWKTIRDNWCDHNPSATIYVKESEWMDVVAWVYKNWDSVAGLSFLPYDGGFYELAPYEEISKDRYDELAKSFPSVDFTKLSTYEVEDKTEGAHEYACLGNSCEI